MWGDHPPRSAVRTLHAYVARLRKALAGDGSGEEVLVTRGRSYQLVVEGTSVDAARFADEAGLGRSLTERGDPGGAVAAFDRALREWAGPPFEGHEDIERCAVAARSLQEIRRGVVEDRFDALLTLGQTAELVPALEAAVREEPFASGAGASSCSPCTAAVVRRRRSAPSSARATPSSTRWGWTRVPSCRSSSRRSWPTTTTAFAPSPAPTIRSSRSPPPSTPPAGRSWVATEELASLVEGWEQLRSGRGGFVSLVGPEGIGKTRLIAELAAIAHQQQAVICFARCDADHRSARAVFDQALRSAGSSLMRVQSDARIGEALGAPSPGG